MEMEFLFLSFTDNLPLHNCQSWVGILFIVKFEGKQFVDFNNLWKLRHFVEVSWKFGGNGNLMDIMKIVA